LHSTIAARAEPPSDAAPTGVAVTVATFLSNQAAGMKRALPLPAPFAFLRDRPRHIIQAGAAFITSDPFTGQCSSAMQYAVLLNGSLRGSWVGLGAPSTG